MLEHMERPSAGDSDLLEIILDSWTRNNEILVNLLRAIPPGGLKAKATAGGPSVAKMFTHVHFVRLIFVAEDAPEFASQLPSQEWSDEENPEQIANDLARSAEAVRNAVEGRIRSGQAMNIHYDHPILFLQHMIWHEGYHHGQIKLALKVVGLPFEDKKMGRLTWGIWLAKSQV